MTRTDIIKALTTEQNRIACAGVPIDIMTITAFMDDAEVIKHLEYYREYVPQPRSATRRRAA